MNKKGFTLAELLGVIVLLSIVSVIAITTIDTKIKEGREKTCEVQEKSIIEAAKAYTIDNPDKLPVGAPSEISINKLINDGYLDKDFKNPITERKYNDGSIVQIRLIDKNYVYSVAYAENEGCSSSEGGVPIPVDEFTPTFSEDSASASVTINFPSGCDSPYTCSYTIDSETTNVTSPEITLKLGKETTIKATVKDTSGKEASKKATFERKNLYVSSSGSDKQGEGYGTVAEPYATISKAYESASKEATIYLMSDLTASAETTMGSSKEITLTSCKKSGTTCSDSAVYKITRGSALTSAKVINNTKGTLTLKNITIDGNNVGSSASLVGNAGTLNVNKDSTITKGNTTGSGGGITSTGTLKLHGATISKNTSGNSGGGINMQGGTLVINENSSITENTAQSYGGGICVSAGTQATINNGSISSNIVNSGMGGGLHCGTDTKCTIKAGTINGNKANGTDPSTGNGGGVSANINAELTYEGGTISNNTASRWGGGIFISGSNSNKSKLTMSGGNVTNNKSITYGGGGIEVDGTAKITGGNINSNQIDNYDGAGIYIGSTGTLELNGGTIQNNTTSKAGYGGAGIHNQEGTFIFTKGTISANSAQSYGGGINTVKGTTTIKGGTISNNSVVSGLGGGMHCGSGSTCNVNSGTITGNKAGGTVKLTGNGAGISVYTTGTLNLKGGTISKNIANRFGGGIYVYGTETQKGNVTMTGGTITENEATTNGGGGIEIEGTVTMSGGEISSNKAKSGGGVMIGGYGSFTLKGGNIINNKADASGAIYNNGTYKAESKGTQYCNGNGQSNINNKCIFS